MPVARTRARAIADCMTLSRSCVIHHFLRRETEQRRKLLMQESFDFTDFMIGGGGEYGGGDVGNQNNNSGVVAATSSASTSAPSPAPAVTRPKYVSREHLDFMRENLVFEMLLRREADARLALTREYRSAQSRFLVAFWCQVSTPFVLEAPAAEVATTPASKPRVKPRTPSSVAGGGAASSSASRPQRETQEETQQRQQRLAELESAARARLAALATATRKRTFVPVRNIAFDATRRRLLAQLARFTMFGRQLAARTKILREESVALEEMMNSIVHELNPKAIELPQLGDDLYYSDYYDAAEMNAASIFQQQQQQYVLRIGGRRLFNPISNFIERRRRDPAAAATTMSSQFFEQINRRVSCAVVSLQDLFTLDRLVQQQRLVAAEEEARFRCLVWPRLYERSVSGLMSSFLARELIVRRTRPSTAPPSPSSSALHQQQQQIQNDDEADVEMVVVIIDDSDDDDEAKSAKRQQRENNVRVVIDDNTPDSQKQQHQQQEQDQTPSSSTPGYSLHLVSPATSTQQAHNDPLLSSAAATDASRLDFLNGVTTPRVAEAAATIQRWCHYQHEMDTEIRPLLERKRGTELAELNRRVDTMISEQNWAAYMIGRSWRARMERRRGAAASVLGSFASADRTALHRRPVAEGSVPLPTTSHDALALADVFDFAIDEDCCRMQSPLICVEQFREHTKQVHLVKERRERKENEKNFESEHGAMAKLQRQIEAMKARQRGQVDDGSLFGSASATFYGSAVFRAPEADVWQGYNDKATFRWRFLFGLHALYDTIQQHRPRTAIGQLLANRHPTWRAGTFRECLNMARLSLRGRGDGAKPPSTNMVCFREMQQRVEQQEQEEEARKRARRELPPTSKVRLIQFRQEYGQRKAERQGELVRFRELEEEEEVLAELLREEREQEQHQQRMMIMMQGEHGEHEEQQYQGEGAGGGDEGDNYYDYEQEDLNLRMLQKREAEFASRNNENNNSQQNQNQREEVEWGSPASSALYCGDESSLNFGENNELNYQQQQQQQQQNQPHHHPEGLPPLPVLSQSVMNLREEAQRGVVALRDEFHHHQQFQQQQEQHQNRRQFLFHQHHHQRGGEKNVMSRNQNRRGSPQNERQFQQNQHDRRDAAINAQQQAQFAALVRLRKRSDADALAATSSSLARDRRDGGVVENHHQNHPREYDDEEDFLNSIQNQVQQDESFHNQTINNNNNNNNNNRRQQRVATPHYATAKAPATLEEMLRLKTVHPEDVMDMCVTDAGDVSVATRFHLARQELTEHLGRFGLSLGQRASDLHRLAKERASKDFFGRPIAKRNTFTNNNNSPSSSSNNKIRANKTTTTTTTPSPSRSTMRSNNNNNSNNHDINTSSPSSLNQQQQQQQQVQLVIPSTSPALPTSPPPPRTSFTPEPTSPQQNQQFQFYSATINPTAAGAAAAGSASLSPQQQRQQRHASPQAVGGGALRF